MNLAKPLSEQDQFPHRRPESTSGFALNQSRVVVSSLARSASFNFVNTLGAILAPIYGIMIVDYYMIKNGKLDNPEAVLG